MRSATILILLVSLCGPLVASDDGLKHNFKLGEREWFDSIYGRATYNVPEATRDGEWEGTWFYANRDAKWMLWIRREQGDLQYRLRFLNLAARETFETDWQGVGSYGREPAEGTFRLRMAGGDDDSMDGVWDWKLAVSDEFLRSEEARIKIYRTGTGRSLVFHFDPIERLVVRDGKESRREYSQVWTFQKASKRMIRWAELF